MVEMTLFLKEYQFLAILFMCLHSAVSQFNYCTVCRDHTVCRFSGVGQRCNPNNGQVVSGLYAGDRERIVNQHNFLRNRVASGNEARGRPGPQPQAANMLRLVWDNELAFIAQRWADQCIWDHDSCRKTARGESVGQNLAQEGCLGNDRSSNWVDRINSWYNEVSLWNRGNVDRNQFNSATGHYTQVVWAKTARIGCGFTRFVSGNGCQKIYACNYAPAGNYPNEPVYLRGAPRSRCPQGSRPSAQYPALC